MWNVKVPNIIVFGMFLSDAGRTLVLGAHLAGPGAGQTAGQGSAVGREGGGERWAAVCQHGFKVTAPLLRLREFTS